MKSRHGLDQVFWSKVDKTVNCWIWKGFIHHSGYGYFRHIVVHRYVFEILGISIPENKEVHHKCQNKLCINPEHLEVISKSLHRGRHKLWPSRTHCYNGHELTKDSIYVSPSGRKFCRLCTNSAARRYNRRRR